MTTKAEAIPALLPVKRRSLSEIIDREKRRARRRKVGAWLGLVAALLVAGLVWVRLRPKPVPLAARFRSAPVTEGDVVREVRATGRLEALTTVQIGAEISGRIATVEVDYNDRVKAGQVLARFDRAALEAQLAQIHATLLASRAAVEQAKTDRERSARDAQRIERLFETGAVSASDRDNVSAAARLAEQRLSAADAQVSAQVAAHQLAKTNLDHAVIRSPIDGVIITRNVDPGQTVASMLQAPVLFTVAADLRKMHVMAAVDEADIGEVSVGQQAGFTVNAYSGRTFTGLVTSVRSSPQVVQDVVTYAAEIEVDNPDLALKPGMTASVRIRTAAEDGALRVPALALRFTPPGEAPSARPAVWTLVDGALRRVEVEAGVSDGELVAVARGAIAPGQAVLVELTPEGRKAHGAAR